MLLSEMVSDCRSLVFLSWLVQVSARITDITIIAQVTLKMIYHALLIDQGGLSFLTLILSLTFRLSTCVHRTNIYIDLSTEVNELSAYCVCRFLIFKGNTILIRASRFSDTCVRESSDNFESMNWRMVDCTRLSG